MPELSYLLKMRKAYLINLKALKCVLPPLGMTYLASFFDSDGGR